MSINLKYLPILLACMDISNVIFNKSQQQAKPDNNKK